MQKKKEKLQMLSMSQFNQLIKFPTVFHPFCKYHRQAHRVLTIARGLSSLWGYVCTLAPPLAELSIYKGPTVFRTDSAYTGILTILTASFK